MRSLSPSLAVLLLSVILGVSFCPSAAWERPPAAVCSISSGSVPDDEDSFSRELLIGWKPCVLAAERDRVIATLGGRHVRRDVL